jgi:class 3 adenylate cyclase
VQIQQRLSQPHVCAPGLSFALAVHAGTVTVGCVGSAERKVYITVGGAMQAVHRLCALALDGQVFASEPVVSKAGAIAGRKPVPVARLEGVGPPVLAYVLSPA